VTGPLQWGKFQEMFALQAISMRSKSHSPAAHVLLALIRAYQLVLSPFIGRQCRYLPTCSAYAADAVRVHGAWAGSWMATARLCRCHPWGNSGYDPVPLHVPFSPFWAPWRMGDWVGPKRVDGSPDLICEKLKP